MNRSRFFIRMDHHEPTGDPEFNWVASYGRASTAPTAAGATPLKAMGRLMILLEELGAIDIEWPNGRIPEEVRNEQESSSDRP